MKLAIEASNIKAGGGLTHLKELIAAGDFHPGETLFVFSGSKTLEKIQDKPYLVKIGHQWLDKGSFFQLLWRIFVLPGIVKKYGINLVFSPGGNWLPRVPFVSMSQNMLVFENKERNRFPAFRDRLRYRLLEFQQVLSFSAAKGVIYISEYARNFIVLKHRHLKNKQSTVVYHGVAERFNSKVQRSDSFESTRLLYVSILNYYKHQDNLILAVQGLVQEGFRLQLDLVGPAHPEYLLKIKPLLEAAGSSVRYRGAVPHDEIHTIYADSDAFIFASSCENMPNILVEAMKSGLPIICSSYGPMPEILGNNGIYFDPASVTDCGRAIREFVARKAELKKMAISSKERASLFTWEECAERTFRFLRQMAQS